VLEQIRKALRRDPWNGQSSGRSWGRWPAAAPCHRQSHHAAGIHPRRPPAQADELLTALLPHTGKRFRLGISGVPGVGKSTFIERWACT
jgi:hypothetical protein